MLAVISDLHLQNIAQEHLRYRKNGTLRECGVRRNVTAAALERFFSMTYERARQRRSKAIHLVLAGDILELHRTPRWLLGESRGLRPYHEPSTALRGRVLEIIEAIYHENKAFFDTLARFVKHKEFGPLDKPTRLEGIEISCHYIPGNHDRLVNQWPAVRKRVRELLAIGPGDNRPFPNRLDSWTVWPDGDYRVRLRHGQEYDPANFALPVAKEMWLDVSWKDYLKPCFGDYLTIDVATRLAMAFRVMRASALHQPGPEGENVRELYQVLTEFDDVRPASVLLDYLEYRAGATDNKTFELLRPILRDLIETAAKDPFFRREARRLGYWNGLLVNGVREGIKNLSGATLASLIRAATQEEETTRLAGPAEVAQFEKDLSERFDVVIGGHTHNPEEVSLPTSSHDPFQEAFYLNSGTWRTGIFHGVKSFARLRTFTMIFCYDADERHQADGRRFETWTGTLAAGEASPYDEEVPEPDAPVGERVLRFESLVVDRMQESGWGSDGAELRLFLGVDSVEQVFEKSKVRTGDVISLVGHVDAIPLDPGLDGQVGCWGWEVDLGDNIIDRDDLLPWAINFLSREPGGAQFLEDSGELVLDNGDDVRMILRYVVERPH
jgi:UDP-2,3-diacylglucosamine pyrophosphatase LpxH